MATKPSKKNACRTAIISRRGFFYIFLLFFSLLTFFSGLSTTWVSTSASILRSAQKLTNSRRSIEKSLAHHSHHSFCTWVSRRRKAHCFVHRQMQTHRYLLWFSLPDGSEAIARKRDSALFVVDLRHHFECLRVHLSFSFHLSSALFTLRAAWYHNTCLTHLDSTRVYWSRAAWSISARKKLRRC